MIYFLKRHFLDSKTVLNISKNRFSLIQSVVTCGLVHPPALSIKTHSRVPFLLCALVEP